MTALEPLLQPARAHFARNGWLCALLALGSLTPAPAAEADAATPHRGRIVILGDSITAGYGLAPAQAYPALLQEKINQAGLPFEVVNAGVSGDTTAGGLRRIEWALGRGADVLVVALGGNDGLRGTAPEQTAANLQALIRRARAKAPALAVLIAGMKMPANLGRDYVEKFNGLFPRVAAEEKAALVPYLLEGVGGVPELNQPDRIHPTAEGQRKIAETIWKGLQPLLRPQAR